MMLHRRFVYWALTISFVTPAAAAEPTAEELLEFNELKTKAIAGNANAQYKLGGIFGKG